MRLRRFFTWIDPGNGPAFSILFGPMQDIDDIVDKNMTGNFTFKLNCVQDLAALIELQDPAFVPLTEIEMFPIKAEIGAGEFRIGE